MAWSKIAQKGVFGFYARNTLDGLAYNTTVQIKFCMGDLWLAGM